MARRIALGVLVACAAAATAWAETPRPHEGMWVGALLARSGPVFMRLVLGGEGADAAGRIDFPSAGERAILLKNVELDGSRVAFDVPARENDLRLEGRLEGDRFEGIARQGQGSVRFEFLRGKLARDEAFAPLAGHYEFAPGQVVLTYIGIAGPMFVDYRTGRLGCLYPLSDGRYVAGSSLLSGYPIDIAVVFERDAAGRVTGLSWTQGDRTQRAVRRALYLTEPAQFSNGDVTLSGTLLLPAGAGPHPAVVMIHGSGPAVRSTLLPVADAMARHGIAVLIHDKRGTGASTGSYSRSTFDDLAGDALAGVAWLRRHPAIDARQIGLQGASLGGWVAPLAAARAGEIAFVMVDAAPATTPAEHERERVRRQMRADGRPGPDIERALAFMDAKFEVGRTGQRWESLQSQMERARRDGWIQYVNAPASLESLQWNWTHILSYDPTPALQALRCPVLALYGERDTIVAPDVHVARMREVLSSAATRDSTIQVLPGANHQFYAASSGGPAESGQLSEFAGGFFDTRLGWLRERLANARSALADGDSLLPDALLYQR